MLDRETIYRKIFKLTDDEIQRIKEGKKADKLEDLTLESMTAPPEAAGGAPEGGAEALPGEEELPTTLGGDAAEATPEAGGEAETQPEGVIREEEGAAPPEVDEKKNMGSTGDSAEISVVKGKDLFAPAEDLGKHVFGTEKQTATDPNDMRALGKRGHRSD
jgi:hypothetical protein